MSTQLPTYCGNFPDADHAECPSSVECHHARVVFYNGQPAALVGMRLGWAYLVADGLAFKVPDTWVAPAEDAACLEPANCPDEATGMPCNTCWTTGRAQRTADAYRAATGARLVSYTEERRMPDGSLVVESVTVSGSDL
jgi:hypothetical protein